MRRLPPNFHSYEHGGVKAPRFTLIAPALGLIPLIRWPLGYQTLHPVRAIVRCAVLIVLTWAFWILWRMLTGAQPPPNEGREFIIYYVAAVLVVTLLRFSKRFIGQGRGEEIHTAEAGYSPLTWWTPFPPGFVEQLVVPGLLGWLGWTLFNGVSVDLGCWLMVCAASYLLLANWEFRNRLSQRRAPVDDKIRAQAFADNLDRHEQQVSKPKLPKPKGKGKNAPIYRPGDEPDVAEVGGGRRRR